MESRGLAAETSPPRKAGREHAGSPPNLIEKAANGLSKFSGLTQTQPPDGELKSRSDDALVWVRMSRDYLAEYVERDVDREKPARERVLGISFVGESRTTGTTRLVLHPSEDGAIGEVVFEGNIRSRTTGRKGPATLHYLANSNVRATKQIVVGENGLQTRRATAQAPTRLTLLDVDTNLPRLRGRIAERIARRRAAASWSQANAIVSDHRERDVRRGLDERLNDRVAEIQSQVLAQVAALELGGEKPETVMRSRSRPEFVEVALYRGDAKGRQLPMPRFVVEGNPDIAVRVHRRVLAQVISNPDLRARFAPVVASLLQSKVLAVDDAATDGGESKSAGWQLGSDWLELDIADADGLIQAERVAADDRQPTQLR